MSLGSNHHYYDRQAVAAGLLNDEVSLGEVRLVADLRGCGGLLLDLGCGSGRLHDHLRGLQLVGIDYAWAQLAAYRGRAPGASLVNGTAARLPFAADTFDAVLMSYHLIESILPAAARESVLKDASRVMTPNGRLFLTHHQRGNYRLRQQVIDRFTGGVTTFGDLLGRGTSRSGGNDLSGFTMHVPSSREIRHLARSAGLVRVDTWDFDSGGRRRWTSRAIVEKYRARDLTD